MLRHTSAVLILLAVVLTGAASAQTHFTNCAKLTGNNATILIPSSAEVSLDDDPLPINSEIAVFTEGGLCAGVAVWKDEPTGFAVWGDDTQTTEKDGFAEGETLTYRIWDASSQKVHIGSEVEIAVTFSNAQPFYTAANAYAEDGIYEITSFSIAEESTGSENPEAPSAFHLYPNYPNPFNPSTMIRYDLPERSDVRISVYDATGREVALLLHESVAAGTHELRWDAGNLPSGSYFCRLQTGGQSRVHTMVLLK